MHRRRHLPRCCLVMESPQNSVKYKPTPRCQLYNFVAIRTVQIVITFDAYYITIYIYYYTFPLLLCFLRTQRWSDAYLSWSWSWHSWEYPWQASHHRRDDKPHRGLGKTGHEGATASCTVHVDFLTASEQIWLHNHSKWQRSKSELAKNAKRRNMNTGTEHRNWVILSSMTSLPSAINATLRTL